MVTSDVDRNTRQMREAASFQHAVGVVRLAVWLPVLVQMRSNDIPAFRNDELQRIAQRHGDDTFLICDLRRTRPFMKNAQPVLARGNIVIRKEPSAEVVANQGVSTTTITALIAE